MMSTPPHKRLVSFTDGIATYALKSWDEFWPLLDTEGWFLGPSHFVWRGQRDPTWPLTSSLDRLISGYLRSEPLSVLRTEEYLQRLVDRQLQRFKHGARGRRGAAPAALTEDEWWALGQHLGLATPLLDWTSSPFGAAFFAFEDPHPETRTRVVFGLTTIGYNDGYHAFDSPHYRALRNLVRLIDPLTDENPRLVSQGGLFTRALVRKSIEDCVRECFPGHHLSPVLLRIEIPTGERISCLESLRRMNLGPLSLFPDLIGAARAANLEFEMDYEVTANVVKKWPQKERLQARRRRELARRERRRAQLMAMKGRGRAAELTALSPSLARRRGKG